jgi:hypothetical protein
MYTCSEADRPIWQYRAGAIPRVRRRRGGAAWGVDDRGGGGLLRAGRRAKAPERRATVNRQQRDARFGSDSGWIGEVDSESGWIGEVNSES